MINPHRSAIFQLSHNYVSDYMALSPLLSTISGISGNDHRIDDFSQEGFNAIANLMKTTLEKLASLDPFDDIDRIAKRMMQERLNVSLNLLEYGEWQIGWNVVASPPSMIRMAIDLMPRKTDTDIANLTARFSSLPAAYDLWFSEIYRLAKAGKATAKRQVLGVVAQLEIFGNGGCISIASEIDPQRKDVSLQSAALKADESSFETARKLRDEYLPLANSIDAFGQERYSMWTHFYLGAELNLRDTYDHAMDDFESANVQIWPLAREILPTAQSLLEVVEFLDRDPHYQIEGVDEWLVKLKSLTEGAFKAIEGVYFDIPKEIRQCDVRLAPEGSSVPAYYTPPSEDFSRPGVTWYSTLGKRTFNWWRTPLLSHHESVPGHHLQMAKLAYEGDRLSRFQRTEFMEGYGEGWATYAEDFMNEIGAYEEPALKFAYLLSNLSKNALILMDIGLHLGYEDMFGQVWTAESAKIFLEERTLVEKVRAERAVNRCLGFPGQFLCYQVGKNFWSKVREDAKERLGSNFELHKFHTHALSLGPMGLDQFVQEMSGWDGN